VLHNIKNIERSQRNIERSPLVLLTILIWLVLVK